MSPQDLLHDEKPTLWIPVGVVGAGKTTFALRLWKLAPERFLRVSLDDIIQMMSFYGYQKHLSFVYGGLEEMSIMKGLLKGYDIYVDRTNLTPETRERFIKMAKRVESLARETLSIWEAALEAGVNPGEEISLFLSHSFEEQEEDFELELKRGLKEALLNPTLPALIPEPEPRANPRRHLKNLIDLNIVALYFEVEPELALKRRLEDPHAPLREITGRSIDWKEVLERMMSLLKIPTKDEGFTHGFRVTKEGTTEVLWQENQGVPNKEL